MDPLITFPPKDLGKAFFPHALCGLQRPWGSGASPAALLPVDSCFGGLALYHEEMLDGSCRYEDVEPGF